MNAFLMATAVALSPAPAAEAPATPTHEVRTGESLSSIAQCELGDGDRWSELMELNDDRIDDPNLIEVGWTLVLPEAGAGNCPEPGGRTARASGTPSAAPRQKSRKVKVTAVQPSGRGQARGNLAGIRNCESSGDYGAVSVNGKYRGAYQFDRQTWAAVGGRGDPAAASADEQDRRAAILYRQRGTSAWPSCA